MCSSRSIAVDRYQGGEPWGERYAGAAGRETMPEAAWKRWDTSSEVAVSNLQIIVCEGFFGFFRRGGKGGRAPPDYLEVSTQSRRNQRSTPSCTAHTAASTRERRLSFLSRCLTCTFTVPSVMSRSEEHTSELQSRPHLVCRLLLEKKKAH